jgi:hypothetical protein
MQTRQWWRLAERAFGESLGVRRSVLCWCVWQECGFSRREDVFTFNLVIKRFYKYYTFNAIYKDNAAKNCITVQHKRFIPVNFDGSYYVSVSNKFLDLNEISVL